MALNTKTLAIRSASAAVFVLILLGAMFIGVYTFYLFFLVMSIWGLLEFYRLIEIHNVKPNRIIGVACGLVLFTWNYVQFSSSVFDNFQNVKILLLLLPLAFVLFLVELFQKHPAPFLNIGATFLGLIYVVLPFKLFTTFSSHNQSIFNLETFHFQAGDYSWQVPLGIILLIWSNDTFAYLVGSLIGKNKMFPRISPGKTWEGTIGGALLTILAAYFLSAWLVRLPSLHWMVIGVLVSVLGTLGDLVESMLKRSLNVKDSGSIMPGHGGVLDRFDSLLFVTPFIFYYLYVLDI